MRQTRRDGPLNRSLAAAATRANERSKRLLVAAVASAVAVAALGNTIAYAASPETTEPLSGEIFFASVILPESQGPSTGQAEVRISCLQGTGSFTASGPATGPYAGTFEETGSFGFTPFPVLPDEPPPFDVTNFEAVFRIHSPAGEVIGRKSFANFSLGRCIGGSKSVQIGSEYEALVRTDDGTFLDQGFAMTELFQFDFLDVHRDRFGEEFGPASHTPFTKQDCKDEQRAELVALFPGGEEECKEFVKDKEAS